jgi:hypothetical protein
MNFPTSTLIHQDLISVLQESETAKGSDNETVCQILIVEKNEQKPFPSNYTTTLLTHKKERFKTYTLKSEQGEYQTVADRLPAVGAKPKLDFASPEEDISRYVTVRTLLQGRFISQLIAKSWLPDKNEISSAIRYLFLTVGQEPERYEGPDDDDDKKLDRDEYFDNLCKTRDEIINLSSTKSPSQASKFKRIIVPGLRNWSGLRLALLLAGQAYLKEDETYIPLCDSIFGAYEIAQLYSFKVSWSTFFGAVEELPKVGASPYQYAPAQEVTIPYPPRPPLDEFTLSGKQIEQWATAKLDEEPWSFYPTPSDEQDTVKYHAPPFPYMPLTST